MTWIEESIWGLIKPTLEKFWISLGWQTWNLGLDICFSLQVEWWTISHDEAGTKLYRWYFICKHWYCDICNGLHSPRHSLVSVARNFISNLGWAHWKALKWMLWYLKGSLGKVIIYGGARWHVKETPIKGYTDSDYARWLETKKSLTSHVFTTYGTAISHKVNLQKVVVLWTTEVKYIAKKKLVKEALWLQGQRVESARQDCHRLPRQQQCYIVIEEPILLWHNKPH